MNLETKQIVGNVGVQDDQEEGMRLVGGGEPGFLIFGRVGGDRTGIPGRLDKDPGFWLSLL